jgi:hypothetical protein
MRHLGGYRMRRACSVTLVFLLMSLLAACADHRTPEQKAQAIQAEMGGVKLRAEAAAAKPDAKAAKKEADKAAGLLADLEKLAAGLPANTTVADARAAARTTCAEIQGLAELAAERAYVIDHTTGMMAAAYRSTESLAIKALCETSALACDQAAKTPAEKLPEMVRSAAQSAALLDQALTNRRPRPDGTPDYAAIAASLRAIGAAPPPELRLALAAAHIVDGQGDLALIEVQQVDPAGVPDARTRLLARIARLAVYRIHKLDQLAAAETAAAAGEGEGIAWFTPETQSGMHLMLAASFLAERKYEKADYQLAEAARVWPNNPATVYLTGERLLAEGKREEAAESLEKAVVDPKYQWLAAAVAKRARVVRDDPRAGAMVFDEAFVRGLAAGYVRETGSAAARSLMATLADLAARLGRGGATSAPSSGAGAG